MIRPTILLLGLCVLLGTPGCHSHDDDGGHEGDHDDHHDDHGDGHGGHHGHGDHDGASEVVTIWGDKVQLFVEFPALVKGEDSPFAAHLTRISDHFAIDEGTVTVELSGGGAPTERFTNDKPSIPGIFRPVVKPAHTAKRQVKLQLDSPAGGAAFDMGTFTVFATREEADKSQGEEEEEGDAISFLLEQQWKIPFEIRPSESRPLRPSVPVFGTLTTPTGAGVVVTAPRDGRLLASNDKFPAVGDTVERGAALALVGTSPGEVDTAAIDLEIQRASIRHAAAKRELTRLEPLLEQGVVSQRRVDEARSELKTADAERRAARRSRANLVGTQRVAGGRDNLAVPAPIGGTVAEVLAAPGTWVQKDQPIAKVVDRRQLWLELAVPEAYIGRLQEISGVWFQTVADDRLIDLPRTALVSVGTQVDAATRTLPVRFAIDNGDGRLFAGMTTRAHLIVRAPLVGTAVPLAAVVDDGGTDVVFVQTGGETFVRRPVKLGVRDGNFIQAIEGVKPGEWVAVTGAYSVKLASASTESVGHGHAH